MSRTVVTVDIEDIENIRWTWRGTGDLMSGRTPLQIMAGKVLIELVGNSEELRALETMIVEAFRTARGD